MTPPLRRGPSERPEYRPLVRPVSARRHRQGHPVNPPISSRTFGFMYDVRLTL